ncbi:MAG TPA: PDC sensor domain-containing protein, partial [Nitrospirales bacterium]|nr:PDC sensor domain-containing protein [Nitrospirales bacterium]
MQMQSQSLRAGIIVASLVGLATALMSWHQVERERALGFQDLDRRAGVLAHRFGLAMRDVMDLPDDGVSAALRMKVEGHRRLLGFAVYTSDGRQVCAGKGVSEFSELMDPPLKKVLAGEAEVVSRIEVEDDSIHVLARRLHGPDGTPGGAVLVVHDSSYLDERA